GGRLNTVNSSVGLKDGEPHDPDSSLDAVDRHMHSPPRARKHVPGYSWLSQATKKT
ncbi:hypothetical protein SARC_16722, partial [Sphaeroforma arctica JP610]